MSQFVKRLGHNLQHDTDFQAKVLSALGGATLLAILVVYLVFAHAYG